MSDLDRLTFRKDVRDHLLAAAHHLIEKSALKGGHSNARYYRCLQPQERVSARSCKDIVAVAKELPVDVDLTKLVDEWKILQLEKEEPGSTSRSIDVYWKQFFLYENTNKKRT